MKKIYILQMHTGTFPSRVIRATTHYPYSHVGISLDESCQTIYSFGRKRLNNFLIAGFVKQNYDDKFYQRFHNTRCRVLELEVTDTQYDNLVLLLNKFDTAPDRYKYDYLGLLLRTLFQRPVVFPHYYVCTQFVAEMLSQTDIARFTCLPCMARPEDFEQLDGCREIYCGKYLAYVA